MWPMLLDTPKDECKRTLRRMELEAYGSLVSALRGQGELSKSKRQLLQDAANALHISAERHRAEIRRAVNDEKLATIAERLAGPNTEMDWAIEGRRLVPLLPRLVPQTAFTALANSVAKLTAAENAKLPPPQNTARSPEVGEVEEAAAPESSRTTQNQGASTTTVATSLISQQPTSQMQQQLKSEETETRKRRRSSLEVPAQPLSPAVQPLPPPPKVAALTSSASSVAPTSRTLTLPMSVAPVKLSIGTSRPTATITTPTSTQKVIIMSSTSNMSASGSPSLLQRSLSVPMVKTTMAHLSTMTSPSSIVSSNIMQSRTITTQGVSGMTSSGFITAAHGSAPRIRPKCSTPATVLPRGRGGSIVIPLTPNTQTSIPPSGLQLKPVATASNKPTLHIKQDGSGMKIIAGAPKLMPKPPTVAVATTTGTTRLVTLTATPRVIPTSTVTAAAAATAGSSTTTLHPVTSQNVLSVGTPTTATVIGPKPVTQLGVTTTASTPGKANVIVVKKGAGYPVGQGMTLAPAGRELLGKVLLRTPTTVASVQKPSTPQSGSGLAQALNIQAGTRQGNVIVVDLSQEHLKGSTVLSEILQASGILSSSSVTPVTPIQPDNKKPLTLDELQDESQDEQQNSPSSSTDTGSSLELNQSTALSFEEAVKNLSPVPSIRTCPLPSELTSTPLRSSLKIVASPSQTNPGTFRLLTVDGNIQNANKPSTEVNKKSTINTGISDSDMQKIEKEMMNLGEGIQQDMDILNDVIKQVEGSDKDKLNDDSMEIQEIPQESMDVEVINQSRKLSTDDVPQRSILDDLCSQDAVKIDKISTEDSSQEDLSQSILARTLTGGDEYQKAVREACQEESSISLDAIKEKPETLESASQESQVSDQNDLMGDLDPQTGIFCLNAALQEDSTSSTSGVSRTVDIYSAAISSANITFDSSSETEAEMLGPISAPVHSTHDSDDEDISLVYHEPDEELEQKSSKVQVEPMSILDVEPTTAGIEDSETSDKVLVDVLNEMPDELLEKQLEELETSVKPTSTLKEGEEMRQNDVKPKEETAKDKTESKVETKDIIAPVTIDSLDLKGEDTKLEGKKEAE